MRVGFLTLDFRVKKNPSKRQVQQNLRYNNKTFEKMELKGQRILHSDLKHIFDLYFLHSKYTEAFGIE